MGLVVGAAGSQGLVEQQQRHQMTELAVVANDGQLLTVYDGTRIRTLRTAGEILVVSTGWFYHCYFFVSLLMSLNRSILPILAEAPL
jgi:hypothetical protein